MFYFYTNDDILLNRNLKKTNINLIYSDPDIVLELGMATSFFGMVATCLSGIVATCLSGMVATCFSGIVATCFSGMVATSLFENTATCFTQS